MDYRVERLRTPAECESFAQNATARNHPDLALEARRKAIHLRASTHEPGSPLEAEGFAAVYAYELLLTRRNGKKTRATGTWQAIKRYGIIEAVQRAMEAPNPIVRMSSVCRLQKPGGEQPLASRAIDTDHQLGITIRGRRGEQT